MKTVIEMAREAGFDEMWENKPRFLAKIQHLVELARADEREKYKWDIHSCGPTCKRYACVAMREAVEAEREACAKVCDDMVLYTGYDCAAAIRARSNT